MIVVHANPKTQPGGVHGALSRASYQSETAPCPANIPPRASAPKFRKRNNISLCIIVLQYIKNTDSY